MHMLKKLDILTRAHGDKELLEDILLFALSEQQAHEVLDCIALDWGIDFEEQED